ncbi:MAG TPA: hypothetical protein P5235_10855 [Saprospiraceae bacterium]|nr:hypothetical protein [Lewinellaceae bacterium]HRX29877.1 hypothetical protein [Saprospiraceae bacterium]
MKTKFNSHQTGVGSIIYYQNTEATSTLHVRFSKLKSTLITVFLLLFTTATMTSQESLQIINAKKALKEGWKNP